MTHTSATDTLTLAIRLLDGKRVLRRFQRSDSLSTVFSYIQSEGVEVHGTQLTAFPAKVLAYECLHCLYTLKNTQACTLSVDVLGCGNLFALFDLEICPVFCTVQPH